MNRFSSCWLVLGLLIVFLGCDNTDGNLPNVDNGILGKWKMTKAYISSGGPQYWIIIEDGEEIEFYSDGKFTSNRSLECTTGSFVLNGENLSMKYGCEDYEEGIENKDGLITYHIAFEEGDMLLTPTSVICIEGCSYKYVKIG